MNEKVLVMTIGMIVFLFVMQSFRKKQRARRGTRDKQWNDFKSGYDDQSPLDD